MNTFFSVRTYSQETYPFRSMINKHLSMYFPEMIDIENIHKAIPESLLPKSLLTPFTDQDTLIHKVIYKIYDNNEFLLIYQKFIEETLSREILEPFYVQRRPTFRVQLPQNLAAGNFHLDSDYGHPLGEVNFWLPITVTNESNTIQIEKKPSRGDFFPVILKPGEYLIFDGRLHHGNVINKTEKTRISFDFRVILERNVKYEEYYDKVTTSSKRSFFEGENSYFAKPSLLR